MSKIGNNDRRTQYSTAGGESSFSYDFRIDDADHIDVFRNGTQLARGSDYSVTGVGNTNGGDIVPDPSLTIGADEVWTLEGDTPEERSNDYSGFTTVKPKTVDDDLDRMIFMLQQLRRDMFLAATKAALKAEEQARISADQHLQGQISDGDPLLASAFSEISWHEQVIKNSVTIPSDKNAWSIGPVMTVASGQEVKVETGAVWSIIS